MVPLMVWRPVRENDPRPNEVVAVEVAREAGETVAESAQSSGEEVISVERYEIALRELASPGRPAGR